MVRPNELEEPKIISIALEKRDIEDLQRVANMHGISISALIRRIIRDTDLEMASQVEKMEQKIRELEKELSEYKTNLVPATGSVYYHRKLDAICLKGTSERVDINTLPEEKKLAWIKFREGEITEEELRKILKK